MRKIDFLIVGVIILITFIIYLIVDFNNNDISNNVQIIINNEVIDEIDIYNDANYIINSDELYIYIYKNNKLIKKINNSYHKDINNIITIYNHKVNMTNSNCKGKDCMYMEINLERKLPIICTNGIVIRTTNNTSSDIIIN